MGTLQLASRADAERSDWMTAIKLPVLPTSVRVGWVLVIALAISYYSTVGTVSGPIDGAGGSGEGARMLNMHHFYAYAALAWSIAYADIDPSETGKKSWRRITVIVLGVSLYGGILEIIQLGFDKRVFDLLDIASNVLGAATILGWYVIRPYLKPIRVR